MTNSPTGSPLARNRLKRGRPPADKTTQYKKIVRCAEEAFVERGYSQTSMDEVAGKAKISKRTLYEYFPNKRELFRAVIVEHRFRIINLSEIKGSAGSPNEMLYRIFLDDRSPEDVARRFNIFQLAFDEASQNPEVRDIVFEAGRRPAVLSLVIWFESQDLFEGHDQEQLASILLDMVFGFASRREVFEMSPEAYALHVKLRVDIFLNGVVSKSSPPD